MQIGKLAEQTGTTPETIRYYEREGLIPQPLRAANGYRDYARNHVQRVNFIRRCRVLELPLEDIKRLLALQDNPQAPCQEVDSLIAKQRQQISERLNELRLLERDLKQLAERCNRHDVVSNCGILGALESNSSPRRPAPSGK